MRAKRAFTIVELLIVVVVIAILAAITIVTFNGVRRSAVDSLVKDTATQAAKAFQTEKIKAGTTAFPTTIPASIKLADRVGLAVTAVADPATFCLNVTHQDFNDIFYSIKNDQDPKEELCEGAVVAVTADYNENAGGSGGDGYDTTTPVGVTKTAPGDLGFTAEVNNTWSSVKLSWEPIEGAQQYRLNHRGSSSATWQTRTLNDTNSGSAWNTASAGWSGNIPSSTTSVTWTRQSTHSYVPSAIGQTHEYRLQYLSASNVWSDWSELTLNPTESNSMPEIRDFAVQPDQHWTKVDISWRSLGSLANLPNLRVQLNHRTSPEGTWVSRTLNDTNSSSGWNLQSENWSSYINPTVNSVTWTRQSTHSYLPASVDQTHEYRIRLISGSWASDWNTVSLKPLEGTLPQVEDFTVTPNSNWSNVTLAWKSLGSVANLPGAWLQINHRTSPTADWMVRIGDSNSGSPWNSSSSGWSGRTPPGQTSVTWTYTGHFPSNTSQVHGYRIRVISGSSAGPWSEQTLSR